MQSPARPTYRFASDFAHWFRIGANAGGLMRALLGASNCLGDPRA
jgi:hypothetical protein